MYKPPRLRPSRQLPIPLIKVYHIFPKNQPPHACIPVPRCRDERGEVRKNYDAVRKSMEMWDENGELQGGTQSRMVDRQAPGEDNENHQRE